MPTETLGMPGTGAYQYREIELPAGRDRRYLRVARCPGEYLASAYHGAVREGVGRDSSLSYAVRRALAPLEFSETRICQVLSYLDAVGVPWMAARPV